jgi:hypothetical protein
VPANTTTEVTLWNTRPDRVRESDTAVGAAAGVHAVRQRGSEVIVEIGSGHYGFTVDID